jgi:hypothetical protein
MANAKDSRSAPASKRVGSRTAVTPVERLQWLRQVQRDQMIGTDCCDLAIALQSFVNSHTGGAFPGKARLAEEIRAATRTVERKIGALIAAGHVHREGDSLVLVLLTEAESATKMSQAQAVEATKMSQRTEIGQASDSDKIVADERQNCRGFATKMSLTYKERTQRSNSAIELSAGEAGACAPAPPSQGAVVERLGVATEGQESPYRTDSLPSPAGSLSRLTARSPAEEGTSHGSEAARYESLDPGPAYEGDVPEIGEPESARRATTRNGTGGAEKVDANELLRRWEEEQKRRDADPDFIHPF